MAAESQKESPSVKAGFLGNSRSISVCLDSGFSKLRRLFRSDKYNVVLGAGVVERGADEITSQGSRVGKNNRQQDTTRTAVNRGIN